MSSLTGQDVGHRMVLRHRLPDGTATDVVGDVLAVDATAVRLQPDDGPAVDVPGDAVVAARRVPPRTVHATSSPEKVQRVLAVARSGRDAPRLGGWLLLEDPAAQVPAALAVGDPGVPVPQALAQVAVLHRERGLTPRVRVCAPLPGDDRWPDPGTAAEVLAAGWRREATGALLTRDLRRDGSPPALPPPGLSLTWQDDDVTLADEDGPIAAGRLAVADRWASITTRDLTAGEREGLEGGVLLGALVARARQEGARFAAVEVAADPADPLASAPVQDAVGAGFTAHHLVHVLTAPSATGARP